MADLDYTFDKYTEKYRSDELDRIRTFAAKQMPDSSIDLEIGSNRGRFLKRMAKKHPGRVFIGLEKRKKYAESGDKRLRESEADNATLLQADAKLAVPVLFDDQQIDNVYIPFPDPWWKSRHRKRRVIRPDFLDLLAPKMTPGGRIWIRTDVGSFANDMRKTLKQHSAFKQLPFSEIPNIPMERSTREDHLIGEALPIHLVYVEKVCQ